MRIEAAGWLVLLFSGCGVAACTGTPDPGAASVPPKTSPVAIPQAEPAAASADLVALARQTLSDHLARPLEEIELVSLEPIDWPDSSLGCPRPDFSYLQVITPGHLALLRHGGVTYEVHMAKNQAFVCERASVQPAGQEKAPTPKLALPLAEAQKLARMDLAQRLGVSVEDVSIGEAKEVVWQDASLGCPQPGQFYKAAPSRGYILNLSSHGRSFTYHTDRYRLVPCPPIERE
jgi:hypothetical protein